MHKALHELRFALNYPVKIDRDTWRYLRDNVPAVTAAVVSKASGVKSAGRRTGSL